VDWRRVSFTLGQRELSTYGDLNPNEGAQVDVVMKEVEDRVSLRQGRCVGKGFHVWGIQVRYVAKVKKKILASMLSCAKS